jgi:hypothetical protein
MYCTTCLKLGNTVHDAEKLRKQNWKLWTFDEVERLAEDNNVGAPYHSNPDGDNPGHFSAWQGAEGKSVENIDTINRAKPNDRFPKP